ncbi:MAG: hypothetical protein V1900_04245 [Candidatus Aenigmatarchaeota archaeon]
MFISTRKKAAFPSLNIKTKIDLIGESFFGPSSSIFVGHFGYPDVFVGPMASIEYSSEQDDPSKWFGKSYDEIIQLRSLLLRSKYKQNIKSTERFIGENREIVLAKKPTDVELTFVKKPSYSMTFSNFVNPVGPSAALKEMRLAENPKIPNAVEKIVNDDIKAGNAACLLYKKGEDVYRITNILSSGAVGMNKNKKLVPTRWSITAVDDMIAKNLMGSIRCHKSVNDFLVFSSDYMDNHFTILFTPGSWQFENFEAWAPGSNWCFSSSVEISEEYEPFSGRSDYAESQVGGYYASRLAICEALNAMKRQASVIAIREIGEDYSMPLGVWQVRENVRNAFRKRPESFSRKDDALKYVSSRLRLPFREYIKRSKILQQKRLGDFF